MKQVLFSLVIISICYLQLVELLTDEQQKRINEKRDECVKETGVDATVLAEARKGNFANDAKLKQHILCVGEKHNFIKDGVVQKDVVMTQVTAILGDADLTQQLYDKCIQDKGSLLETVFAIAQCYISNTHVAVI
ncbi:unnamed protein product [Phyllotreta striolata]|uniref:Uncharacterized protein n=1 Tax=Phyllotreta striolata TaxID=444603 RepID=A0A9N9XM35_PHYSR|nr:unnamed protein product [Phyllotreta striolata]